jgi:hypothetical protein
MARLCESCGRKVSVGQGKWVPAEPPNRDWSLQRLYHKTPDLCAASQTSKRGANLKRENRKGRLDASSGGAGQGQINREA